MDLYVGQCFSEYKALEEAIAEHERIQKIDVMIRYCHRIDSARIRNRITKLQIKPELKYCNITYCCVFGGLKSKKNRLYILFLDIVTEFWIWVDFL